MIRINFDPTALRKAGSFLFVRDDLKDARALAVRTRTSADPLSQHLRSQLAIEFQERLDEYDGSNAVSESLLDALVAGLNQLLSGPLLDRRNLLAGITLQKDGLIRSLIKLKPSGDILICVNRLLLEEAYPLELERSLWAEWDGWNFLARAATRTVIKEWETWKTQRAEWKKEQEKNATTESGPKFNPSFDDDVWKGFRNWLLNNIFHNKCAYCETPHVGFPGDAEHFRPKGRVRKRSENDDLEIATVVDENNETIAHPGYFWLAYHWENLLPACETCNRGGKNDLFPVKKNHVAVKRLTVEEVDLLIHKITESESETNVYYLEPDDLDKLEDRLLLHPYRDNPEEHIYFQADGTASDWKGSELGKSSIRVYNLNDTATVRARARAQVDGLRAYSDEVVKAAPDLKRARSLLMSFKNEYYNGERPYAAAVFDYIHFYLGSSRVDPRALMKETDDQEAPSQP